MRAFYVLGICLFVLLPASLLGQEKQSQQGSQPAPTTTSQETSSTPAQTHQLVITPEQKALKNPVKFTEESAEKGKKLFATQCAMCHGQTGNGKGDLAEVMHITPPDFTKPETLANRTDGELFTIIDSGTGSMPGEAKRLKENQAWDLVNFLRTLEGKTPAKLDGKQGGAKN